MAVSVALTVAAGKVASDLTGFVVRVDLSHLSNAWWTDTTTDLGNVRVKSSGSVIPFDVVAYDRTAKTGELFFRAPSLAAASANVFTVETVNSATALAATDPNGRNAVWADYMAVFVTSGVGMADQFKDRAGKSGDLTVATGTLGTPTNPGWLKGSGNVNVKSVGVGFQTTFHMAASYVMATASGNNSIIAYSTDTSLDNARELMCLESGVNLAMYNSTDSFHEHLGSEGATPNTAVGVRERGLAVKNGSTSRWMYKNGVKGTVDSSVVSRPASPGNALWLLSGYGGTASRFFGEINYVYLRSGVPSDDWAAAEYVSWETPSSFYSVPTDATVSGGTAHETDSARAGTTSSGPRSIAGGAAHETDTAHTGTVDTGSIVAGGTAHETDAAHAGATVAGATSVSGGTASEVDTAHAGTASTADVEEPEDGPEYTPELPDDDPPPAVAPDSARLIRLKAISVPPVELVDGRPTEAWKAQAVEFEDTWAAYELYVGGEDVTLFRGYPVQIGTRQHKSPFSYAALDIVIPGVTPWETALWGTGAVDWMSEWAPVVLRAVDAAGVSTVLWRGFVGSVEPAAEGLRLTCAGEARGRLQFAENLLRPFAAFRDIGAICYDLARRPGLKITPAFGVETGYIVNQQSIAGGKLLEALDEYFAKSQQPDGDTLTAVPTGVNGNVYNIQWTDFETVHYTVFYGAHGISPSLSSNLMDRPTTLYGVGRDHEGGFWANFKARLSTPANPPPFPGTLSSGDTGEAVNIWQANLIGIGGYLKRRDAVGGFNAATVEATKDFQEDAGLPQTGIVNLATWNASFDIEATGTVTTNGHMVPLAQLNSTRRFFETSSGVIYAANPDYDPLRPKVEEITDYGTFEKKNARKRARGRRARLANEKQWAGTLRLDTDLFVGDYHHGDPDPVLESRFVPLDGKNIMLRGWDGDTLLHIVEDDKDSAGATVTGDTMARPPLEVRQLVERNKEGRQNPAKTFMRQHRGTEIGGPVEFISELGGELPLDQNLDGGRWNLLDDGIVAGDTGTLSQIALNLTGPACEFAVALFASPVTEAWCNANLPEPFDTVGRLRNLRVTDGGSSYESAPTVSFSGGGGSGAHAVAHVSGGEVVGLEWTSRGSGYTSAPSVSLSGGGGSGASADVSIGGIGARSWDSEEVRDMLDRRRILLGGWGDAEQPCGYGPTGIKSEGDPLTGKWLDGAGIEYRTFANEDVNNGKRGKLYMVVFPKVDTTAKAQRVLWPSYEVGM